MRRSTAGSEGHAGRAAGLGVGGGEGPRAGPLPRRGDRARPRALEDGGRDAPGYATGTKDAKDTLADLGAKLMKHHHTGRLTTAIHTARVTHNQDLGLSTAPGLSDATHKHFAALAEAAGKHLKALTHDLAAVRAYRTLLKGQDKTYEGDIRAAKAAHLPKEVIRLQRLISRNDKTVGAINHWITGKDSSRPRARSARRSSRARSRPARR